MPQLVALAMAGAGIYAGYRWFTRKLAEAGARAAKAEAELRRHKAAAEAAKEPRDLGQLSYDEDLGVYRPRRLH